MDAAKKRALREAYKSKPVLGGVCRIVCAGNQRALVQASVDVESLRNRFQFALATGTCPDPSLRGEWEQYGSASFTFTVLETLKKGEDQTQKDFADDVNLLCEIWREKLHAQDKA